MVMDVRGLRRIREDRQLSWMVGGTIFLAALVVWLQLETWHPAIALITFMPAITLVALAAGWRVATLATIASALIGWWLLLRPPGTPMRFPRLDDMLGLCVFAGSGTVIVVVVESLARAAWPATGTDGEAPADVDDIIRASVDVHLLAAEAVLRANGRDPAMPRADGAVLAAARARIALSRLVAEHLRADEVWSRGLGRVCADILRAKGADTVEVRIDVAAARFGRAARTAVTLMIADWLLFLTEASVVDRAPGGVAITVRRVAEGPWLLDMSTDAVAARRDDAARAADINAAVMTDVGRMLDARVSLDFTPTLRARVAFRA